jgi:predicted metal-dependent peptidase
MLWNVAADHVCNLLAKQYGFPPPTGCFCDAKYTGLTAEKVYDLLLQEQEAQGKAGGKPGQGEPGQGKAGGKQGQGEPGQGKAGGKQGQGEPGQGEPGQGKGSLAMGDVMDYDPSQNEGKTASEVEREIGINTENAVQAAKAAGSMPAGMKRLLGEAQVQREPWHQHLRRFMTSMNAREYNWARIDSRRAVLHGVISPQMKSEAMGKVVFMVDCSGSITNDQLSAMGAHISDICRETHPKDVVVAYFDTEVSFSEEFTGPDYDIVLTPHGGGGTNFRTGAAWIDENHSDAVLAIWLTDMYGPMAEGCSVETLWVSSTEGRTAPYGEVLIADFND